MAAKVNYTRSGLWLTVRRIFAAVRAFESPDLFDGSGKKGYGLTQIFDAGSST
jgi:hypothetical protein